jgi:hypothetical protein
MATNKTKKNQQQKELIFGKKDYLWIVGGILLMALGFLLMTGGGSDNPNEFNAEELYSFRRITLAPLLVILGLVVEMIAIMRKPKG